MFTLATLLISCEKEGIPTPLANEANQETGVKSVEFNNIPDKILNSLNGKKISKQHKNLVNFGQVRKDIPAYINKEKTGTTYTIALAGININSKSNDVLFFDNLVVQELPDGEIRLYVFRYTPDMSWYRGTRDLENYSGGIAFFELNGNKLGQIKLIHGHMEKQDSTATKAACNSFILDDVVCIDAGDTGSGMCTYYYVPYCSGEGSTSGGDDFPYPYDGSGDSDWGDDPSGPSGGDPSSPGTNPIIDENGEQLVVSCLEGQELNIFGVCEEDTATVQIFNELEGKELCAYNRLQWAGVNASNYVNLMTQLFIEFGEGNIGAADLVITERDLLDSTGNVYRGGGTFQTNDGKFEIVLSRMGNSSSIEIAAVLVHEMAHAFLAKHYSLYNNSFEELYSMYLNDHGLASYSHDIMGDKFINRIAQVLYDYDNTLFTNFDDYKILASAGVYEFDEDQLAEYNLVRNYAKINDERCQNVD